MKVKEKILKRLGRPPKKRFLIGLAGSVTFEVGNAVITLSLGDKSESSSGK